MKRHTIYFSHPMGYYNTPLETEFLAAIQRAFPESEILNPNTNEHASKSKGDMDYFLYLVKYKANLVIAMPYEDGQWGAGVWAEMKTAKECGIPVQMFSMGVLVEVDCDKIEPLGVYDTADKNHEVFNEIMDKTERASIKKPAIIIDLDGTLCDVTHRVHHMKGKRKNWKAFMDGIGDDKPHPWCISLVAAMRIAGYDIIYLTGRGEEERKVSELWLNANSPVTDYVLLMRKGKDWRKDTIVKKEIYDRHVAPHYDVLFAVDDRAHIAEMWRSIGVPCLHCADEEIGETVELKDHEQVCPKCNGEGKTKKGKKPAGNDAWDEE